MNITPPSATEVESRVNAIHAHAVRKISRERRTKRVGLGAAVVAAIAIAGIGGATVATAFHPTTIDMQGVIKTKFLNAFVDCSEDAGVETVILTGAAARGVLDGWTGVSARTHSVIELRMDSTDQGELGRAISACQAEVTEESGEPIF